MGDPTKNNTQLVLIRYYVRCLFFSTLEIDSSSFPAIYTLFNNINSSQPTLVGDFDCPSACPITEYQTSNIRHSTIYSLQNITLCPQIRVYRQSVYLNRHNGRSRTTVHVPPGAHRGLEPTEQWEAYQPSANRKKTSSSTTIRQTKPPHETHSQQSSYFDLRIFSHKTSKQSTHRCSRSGSPPTSSSRSRPSPHTCTFCFKISSSTVTKWATSPPYTQGITAVSSSATKEILHTTSAWHADGTARLQFLHNFT